MLNSQQKKALEKLIEIKNGLPIGTTLTFAADNTAVIMDDSERTEFVEAINSLIEEGYLASHTDKKTPVGVPYWLEFTSKGRDYQG